MGAAAAAEPRSIQEPRLQRLARASLLEVKLRMRAFNQGLKVIACVGQTLEQREAGPTLDVAAAQTKAIAGSVNGGNCEELAAKPDDGFLDGGASLKFIDIIKSAEVKKAA